MIEKIALNSGKYEIISNGSLLQVSGEPVIFTFCDGDDKKEFCFLFDPETRLNETERTEIKKGSGNIPLMVFRNFRQGRIDNANSEPLLLGTLQGRKLFFSYRIDFLSKASLPILNYTWFIEKPEKSSVVD